MLLRVTVLALLAGFLCACDRRKDSEVPVIPVAPVETGPAYVVDLQPITPLSSNRITHVAADAGGNVYWLQETEAGDDALFMIGEGQIPRVTDLTTSRAAAAISGGAAGATGRIQSIAAGRSGEIYFYFLGTAQKRLLAALAIYTPKNNSIRVLADTEVLKSASGLGASLSLARGTLYANKACLWLWVRHSDDAALFRVRHIDVPPAGALPLGESRLSVTVGDQKILLTSDDFLFSPAGEDSLFWLDPEQSQLKQIDALGRVKTVRSLIGLPVALSAPTLAADGKLLMFAADAPIMEPQQIEQVGNDRIRLNVKYPALLMLGQNVKAVGADNFSIYSGFPLSAMRIRTLVPEAKATSWVAYDLSSGELLRLRLVEKSSSAGSRGG